RRGRRASKGLEGTQTGVVLRWLRRQLLEFRARGLVSRNDRLPKSFSQRTLLCDREKAAGKQHRDSLPATRHSSSLGHAPRPAAAWPWSRRARSFAAAGGALPARGKRPSHKSLTA